MPRRDREKDRAILDYIQAYTIEHGYPPSLREMATDLDYKNRSVLHYQISRLRREGHVAWEYNRNRTIRVLVPQGTK